MKRYVRLSACILAVLSLCSCLRDAVPGDADTMPTASSSHDADCETAESTVPAPLVTEADTLVGENEEVILTQEAAQWCYRNPDADKVIMTHDEISKENERILNSADSMTDIFSFGDTVSSDTLREMIAQGSVPSESRYDKDGSEIPSDHIDTVRRRMTVDTNGDHPVRLGIMTSRGNVRTVPDDKPYRKAPSNPYDSVQSTELSIGTPVLVLYTTYDLEYCFAVSYNYSGWIKSTDVAISTEREKWLSFADPKTFVCVTDPLYRDGDIRLDMGAILPFTYANGVEYTVTLPIRNADGSLGEREYALPHDSACIGYLSYTYKNYLAQAYKYEGTPYGWGGLDDGVDCSGLVLNVFRCFGFRFPRDTSQQDKTIGDSVYVGENPEVSAAHRLDTTAPTVVYYPGHTLLYIGRDETDGLYYFIHAPQLGECVTVTSKSSLAGMTYVCRIAPHS